MSEEIILYYNPRSRARTTHWMLEEIGAPYRLELVRLDRGDHKKPAFLAINPMGKLPTLVHRNTVVTESAAICAYLADAFPAARLAPGNEEPARGTYLRWMFFGAGCLEPALMDHMLARPQPERTSAIGYGTYADTFERPRDRARPRTLHSRRPFQRRGRVSRLADFLRHDDEDHRAAPCLRGLRRSFDGTPCLQAREHRSRPTHGADERTT